jgi:hypothetical protein
MNLSDIPEGNYESLNKFMVKSVARDIRLIQSFTHSFHKHQLIDLTEKGDVYILSKSAIQLFNSNNRLVFRFFQLVEKKHERDPMWGSYPVALHDYCFDTLGVRTTKIRDALYVALQNAPYNAFVNPGTNSLNSVIDYDMMEFLLTHYSILIDFENVE